MSEHIRLIVGLGNPGSKYQKTWHNLGFNVIESLAVSWNCVFRPGKGEFLLADTEKFGNVTLLKPTSFMNRSGSAVGSWLRYYKIEPGKMLVVYDDHDIPLGKIRLRENGSAGGHHGMEDIIRIIGSDQFPRLRIGIQTESTRIDLADRVLSEIPSQYKKLVESAVTLAADAAECAVRSGVLASMNRYNGIEL